MSSPNRNAPLITCMCCVATLVVFLALAFIIGGHIEEKMGALNERVDRLEHSMNQAAKLAGQYTWVNNGEEPPLGWNQVEFEEEEKEEESE